MYDIEKVIEKRIALARRHITPLTNTAIARHNEIEIRVLQTAPRDEQALEKLLQKKRAHVEKITNAIEAAPLYDELAALEWLLPKVLLRDTYHTENDFV